MRAIRLSSPVAERTGSPLRWLRDGSQPKVREMKSGSRISPQKRKQRRTSSGSPPNQTVPSGPCGMTFGIKHHHGSASSFVPVSISTTAESLPDSTRKSTLCQPDLLGPAVRKEDGRYPKTPFPWMSVILPATMKAPRADRGWFGAALAFGSGRLSTILPPATATCYGSAFTHSG